MKRHAWIITPIFLVILQACIPAPTQPVTPTSTPAPVATQIPTSTPPATLTPSPTLAPTATLTLTPVLLPVYASTRDQPVNCRFGPGIVFEVVDGLQPRQTAQVTGRTIDNMWWYVQDPNNPGGTCWVFSAAVDMTGDTGLLPVVGAPPVTVDKLEVSVDPPRISVACTAFPQYFLFTGNITANGPTVVKWHWELSTGEVTSDETLIFEQAGTQTVQKSFVVYNPNDYWTQIHITGPNEMVQQANFVANCSP